MLIVVFFQSKYVYLQKTTLFLLQYPFLFICSQLEIITRWRIIRDEAKKKDSGTSNLFL